jgi:hypothetical protein
MIMKNSLIPLLSLGLLVLQALGSEPATPAPSARRIPLDQLGAEAQKQYSGEGISIQPTAEGARLRAAFQDLEGQVTPEGLWLTSTAEEADAEPPSSRGRETSSAFGVSEAPPEKAGSRQPLHDEASPRSRRRESSGLGVETSPPERFRVLAVGVGASSSSAALARTGRVQTESEVVRLLRPGVIEEYRVSMDGVRQDFLIPERPAGAGELTLALEVSGARAEAADYGARLTLAGSGRVIAYSRLHVTDATGRELPARMEAVSGDRLSIQLDDTGAVYPVRIDPTFSDDDWVSVGICGTYGFVFAMVADQSGNIYVAGQLGFAGNVQANGIAKWNGTSWSSLGAGLSESWTLFSGGGYAYALALSGSNLYVGGAISFCRRSVC